MRSAEAAEHADLTGSGAPDQYAVLVADGVNGRSRSAVAAVRALSRAGYRPFVAVAGRPSAAAVSRHCAGVYEVPEPSAASYGARLQEAEKTFLTVLPASDGALVALRRPGAGLVDKEALARRVLEAGLRSPSTVTYPCAGALVEAAEALAYPVVVKPVLKSGPGSVARRAATREQLIALAGEVDGACVVQAFYAGSLRAVSGVVHEGRLLAVVHQRYVRTWPTDCGVASAAVTTGPDPELELGVVRLLGPHSGVFQVQLVEDMVIDVNPRVYGSLPLAVAAGANLPGIACAALRGRRPAQLVRGRAGVRYRWLEGDVRHVLHRLRHGEVSLPVAIAALRPFRGTAHSIESLADPRPMLTRLERIAGAAR